MNGTSPGQAIAPSPKHRVRKFAALLVAAATMSVLLPTMSAGAADPPPSQITVVKPSHDPGWLSMCAPGATWVLFSNHGRGGVEGQYWEFWFEVYTRPCDTQNYAAVVYSIPGGRANPWPQYLVERVNFTVANNRTGKYRVQFQLTCDDQQFDVISGGSPDIIGLGYDMHGPLIYPADVNTSSSPGYQYFVDSSAACGVPVPPQTTLAPT